MRPRLQRWQPLLPRQRLALVREGARPLQALVTVPVSPRPQQPQQQQQPHLERAAVVVQR
jgi:hypothetical protein